MFFFSSCTVSSTLVSKEVVETAVQECSETPDEDRFEFSDWAFVIIILYIYIYTIYRHVFHCSTAHQCSLVQSGYGMATIYTQAIVSDYHLWDNSCHAHIQRA